MPYATTIATITIIVLVLTRVCYVIVIVIIIVISIVSIIAIPIIIVTTCYCFLSRSSWGLGHAQGAISSILTEEAAMGARGKRFRFRV